MNDQKRKTSRVQINDLSLRTEDVKGGFFAARQSIWTNPILKVALNPQPLPPRFR